MTIEAISIGANSGKKRYFIKDDDGGPIAAFDSLEVAGAVIRYLKGAPMARKDNEKAVDALRAYDAQHADPDGFTR